MVTVVVTEVVAVKHRWLFGASPRPRIFPDHRVTRGASPLLRESRFFSANGDYFQCENGTSQVLKTSLALRFFFCNYTLITAIKPEEYFGERGRTQEGTRTNSSGILHIRAGYECDRGRDRTRRPRGTGQTIKQLYLPCSEQTSNLFLRYGTEKEKAFPPRFPMTLRANF